MPEWVTYAFPAASLAVGIIAPWLAIRGARGHFEGVVDTKFRAIDARLESQDKAIDKQFGDTKATVKDALDRLYQHERELGALSAGLASARGFSGR